MKLGIMQPYFMPYAEYFRLIAACDVWIAFDTVKYNRKSWMNRNRIANRDKGWSYVRVPVARGSETDSLATARIDATQDWRRALFDALRVYRHSAPHYEAVTAFLTETLAPEVETLAELNMLAIQGVCDRLGIATPLHRLSALDLDLPEACPPGEWALQIAREMGASTYLNASGGTALFDPKLYAAEGIALEFHEHIDLRYDTGPFDFVPDLSIIDAMMWVDRKTLTAAV
ncbi:WbqC family protein [Paralimibaculum aggregatum]|uniref:WbqC family protein n=1 Tax=Paralimibaculum aggregatum TaxID=3036245 RepID=A0ABQ6LU51_9RHOB|nr:WbqC family protein [Limibaculum sp. NKW23]GMG85604.1 WbqC family protein [Limibaculum sp. NKW23]